MTGIIKRNFTHIDMRTFVLMYRSIVRPHLAYAVTVWCPMRKRDIEDIKLFKKEQLNR